MSEEVGTGSEMVQALKKKVSVFLKLTDEESEFIEALDKDIVRFARADEIVSEGQWYRNIYINRSGWAMRSRDLPDGRRQIVNFVLPGDFMCFNGGLFEVSADTITAVTNLEAVRMDIKDLAAIFARYPRLGAAFAWCNGQDESILAERVTSLGRRSAYERMAHLFLELWRRLQLLDLTEGDTFRLPVTRDHLADVLGLTTIHVYRTLRRLIEDDVIALEKDGIRIVDCDKLETAAKFEEDYLHYTEVPARTARILDRIAQR